MSVSITLTNLAFELRNEIGQHGRNSQVFIAHDKQLNSIIVVKKIEKSRIADPAKFYEEARRLNDSEHQHVVQVKFASDDTDHIYIGMPYYAAGSLKDLIDKRFLTVREIVRFAIQLLSGLNNIHSKKLIHFDIKPDNILIADNGEILIADFGIAKNMDLFGLSEIDQAYFKHIPPEYFSTTTHSMLFDIYSAGLTLYRMCNGNQAFYNQLGKLKDRNAVRHAIVNGQFPDRNEFKYHIPRKLRKIIKKAIAVKPENRYQTVLEMLNALAEVDELLDWRYSEGTDYQQWEHDTDERKIVIALKILANSKFNIVTSKTIKASGNTTNVSKGCVNGIEERKIEDFIVGLLEEHG